MYILMIARGYTAERYILNGILEFDQAKALVKAGHKVIYAAVDVRSIRRWRKWGIEHIVTDGVIIYAINIPVGKVPKGIQQSVGLLGLNILYRKISQEHGIPEIIHAHFADVGYTVSKLTNKINLPFVMTEHLSLIMKPVISKGLYRLASNAYENADALIAVSPELKEVIKNRFGKNAIYIPNLVDSKFFYYHQARDDGIFRFVSVGRLTIEKGMFYCIKAFIDTFKDNNSVCLTIFGEGPERKKLENLIFEHNMIARIKLMGLQKRRTIAEYLRMSNCFVLASQAETFGVGYIEALASGVPVIATRCGGPESFVDKDNGILVPVDDVENLGKAMCSMYCNFKKYDRSEIASKIKTKFSPEVVASKLGKVYETVIANNKQSR